MRASPRLCRLTDTLPHIPLPSLCPPSAPLPATTLVYRCGGARGLTTLQPGSASGRLTNRLTPSTLHLQAPLHKDGLTFLMTVSGLYSLGSLAVNPLWHSVLSVHGGGSV